MKKAIVFIFVVCICAALFAGCGGSDDGALRHLPGGSAASVDPPPDNDSPAPAETPGQNPDSLKTQQTPSITPAEGFVKNDKDIYNLTYNKSDGGAGDTLTFIIMKDTLGGLTPTVDAYIAKIQDALSQNSDNSVFSEVSDVKVNGYDAKEFTFSMSMYSVTENGRYDLLVQNGVLYIISCLALNVVTNDAAKVYDANAADFQAMIDSFALK